MKVDLIIEDLKIIKNYVKDSNIVLYLLEKSDSNKPDKMRKLKKANVESSAKSFFSTILIKKLNSILKNDNEFSEYFNASVEENKNLYLEDTKKIPVLPHLIEQIKQNTNLETLTTLDEKSLRKYQGFLIEFFHKNKTRMLYFSRFEPGAKLTKGKFFLSFDKEIFSKVEGDLIRFNENIDFIYYSYFPESEQTEFVEKIVILNRKNTELLLNFKEIFKKETNKAFKQIEDSPYISITDKAKEEVANDTNFIKRIAVANSKGLFNDLSIQQFKNAYENIDGIKYKINGDRITIISKEQFDHILDVLERNHVVDFQNSSSLFKAKTKKPMKRKK